MLSLIFHAFSVHVIFWECTPLGTALNKSKRKEKGFFFSFRFKTTSHRLRYIGRISGARCDLDGL
jgi:hypothetical protein